MVNIRNAVHFDMHTEQSLSSAGLWDTALHHRVINARCFGTGGPIFRGQMSNEENRTFDP